MSLTQIQQIAESGTPGLALTLLEESHPGTQNEDFEEWLRWSKARTEILVRWKQWSRAADYLTNLPAELPPPLQRWAMSQRAWLLLEQGETAAARKLLVKLVWEVGDREQDSTEGALWRRLIIRSYLNENEISDAATAMHRYQQDYASDQAEWLQLRATVFLRQGNAKAISEWSPEALNKLPLTLRLLIELRSRQKPASAVYAEALARINDETANDQTRARYWKIAAEAALLDNNAGERVEATEKGLLGSQSLPADDTLFRTEIAELWDAYQAFGIQIGNEKHLLIGDDATWFDTVKIELSAEPLKAKGLLAVLANQASSLAQREQALVQLVDLIETEQGEPDLVALLFFDQTRFPTLQHVPTDIRYRLVEYALSVSDIVLASDLFATLPEQPAEIDAFEWGLRRARVLVMGGRFEQGKEALDTVLGEQLFLSEEQLDKLMQVLFDLQASGSHASALAFFSRLENERHLPPKQRRELFFWMAESFKATGQYANAALYYMRSATYTDPNGADLWGQSARYNAAEALMAAGLNSDARRLYKSLLTITEDPAHRAALHRKLQQLLVSPESPANIGD